MTENSVLELVLPLRGQDSPFALASPSPLSVSNTPGRQRRQSPRPLSLARVVLNLLGSGPEENCGPSQNGDRDRAQLESFAKLSGDEGRESHPKLQD